MGVLGCGGSAQFETVVRDSRGNELRGEIVGEEDACREGAEGASCRVRVAGGSVLAVPAEDVVEVTRERRYRSDTGHSGQLGLTASVGAAAGLTWVGDLSLALAMPVAGDLTYGITDALELDVGYRGFLLVPGTFHYGSLGTRYFFAPTDPIKLYTGAAILVGTGVGVHTRSGIQFDFGRYIGLFLESGFTITLEYTPAVGTVILWEAGLGLHGRFW